MEIKAKKLAELLKIIANENRLLILCALVEESMNVNTLATYVPKITQSALSQHLLLLKTAGIISSQKDGLHVTYTIADQRIIEVLVILKKQYC
jgi:DNA-binding transcriptional ArsR family regulator